MLRSPMAIGLALCLSSTPAAAAAEARLLRFPDVHGDTVAFSHGGDLWTVPASGGTARRLTSGAGLELFPRFSPDGKWIAFTGQYDGSSDVYVIPSAGGAPRRLTWYPSRENPERLGFDNMVVGWTPDGRVLFRSQRGPLGGFLGEPYTVRPEGGAPEPFPLPEMGLASFSPDGKKLAMTRVFRDFRTWKRYQGGLAPDIWICDLATRALERVTDWRGTDTQPMWIGDAIYYLSDQDDWRVNLWRYDLRTRERKRVTDFKEFDVKWAHSGSGRIVFENGGFLYLFDPAGNRAQKIPVEIPDDRRDARERWVRVDDKVTDASIGPDGQRAVFTARGDVFTVPAERGDVRNVTRTQGVREKNATWSPDGRSLAYFSDATGEEELYVVSQDGKRKPVQVTHGPPSWHFPPVWSPDSKKIAYADRGLRLFFVDVAEKTPVLVVHAPRREISEYAWSPDSRWIAYATDTETDFSAIHLYSLDSRSVTRVTSDAFDSHEPVFDPLGRYLYFLSDRDVSPTIGRLELSYTVTRMTRPHAITLRADVASPFAPKSDEVKPWDEAEAEKRKEKEKEKAGKEGREAKAEPLRIDLAGIEGRVVPFPVPPGNDGSLRAAKDKVYWLSFPTLAPNEGGPPKGSLRAYDLEKRKETEVLAGVEHFDASRDGAKILYKAGATWGIAEPKEGLKAGDGALKLEGMKMELDPVAEWRQIFFETWRLYRDFFYLPDMGRVDWAALRRRYEPLLPHVTHRYDLTYVLGEMAAELGSGHAYVGGGDAPHPERVPVGTLGADLALDRAAGRWRIARILPGQSWIESRRSPLAAPGLRVSEGDYLLAVDGQALSGADDPYRLLAGTPGRTVTLTVNGKPTLEGAREVSVEPLPDEWDLRYSDWVERNRRKVEAESGGRVGYVHIPDMGVQGLAEFIRQYYPQVHKEGLVVDVRANRGGFVSQMILERLRRRVVAMSNQREEAPTTYPLAAFHGPMVAVANQYSASDGDIFAWAFRAYGLGPIVGERTWGGTVGIRFLAGGMVDGGYTTVPEFGIYGLQGNWIAENEGVAPDIEVDNLPADVAAGRDPQLERAVAEVLKRVEAEKPSLPPRPGSKDLRSPAPPGGG